MAFLRELDANNERDWFHANKLRYEADVREVALDYIADMGPKLAKLSDYFEAIPKKTGGSLMRPYRDTRFGKDKTPYKTNIGIQFRHERGKDVHAPGFYLHIDPNECYIGVGLWRPDPDALLAIRTRIAERPEEWRKIAYAKAFRNHFTMGGSALKRAPRGFDPDHPMVEDLKRKDFIASCTFAPADVATAQFTTLSAQRFRQAMKFMGFLCTAMELQY